MHRNVQRLDKLNLEATPRRQSISLTINTRAFHDGWVASLTQLNVRGFDVSTDPHEQGLVDILTNLMQIAREDWPDDETVTRYYAGVIAGWLLRQNVGVSA